MPREGFYNTNRFRSHPFVTGTVGNPTAASLTVGSMDNDTVVDVGFIMGLYSRYEDGVNSVWLDTVHRSGSIVTFTFKSDAASLVNRSIVFTRDLGTATQYEVEYVDDVDWAYDDSLNAPYTDSEVFEVSNDLPDECPLEPLWSGYLVTGTLINLAATLVDGQTLTRSSTRNGPDGVVEPCLTQNLSNSYVSSINIANTDRTRVTSPGNCSPVRWAYPVSSNNSLVYVSARCLRGDVKFSAGYNMSVFQEPYDNAVILNATPGAGLGSVCENEPTLFPGERPPTDSSSTLLEGGPACSDLVRSINGVGGPFSSLLSGTGVSITTIPAASRIIVSVNMNQLAVCYSDDYFSEVSDIA